MASIIVPTRDRRESVLRLLRALRYQSVPPDTFEVVVSIDGSEDGTADAVAGHSSPFRLRYLWHPRRGRAAACNTGARAASGKLVVFLDDDIEPAPEFLGAHIAAQARTERIGIVGPVPILVSPESPPVVEYRAAAFARKMERLAQRGADLRFTDIYTGNFSIGRAVFIEAGGYDEDFTSYGHEDYELALRLARAGVRFGFEPAAVARQHYEKSFRSLADDTESEGRTAVLFALKHPEVLSDLPLSGYGRRSCRTRVRIRALLAATRLWPGFPAWLTARIERLERRTPRHRQSVLFGRYRLAFDYRYWLGVERALTELGAARGRVGFHDIERCMTAAAVRAGDRSGGRAAVTSS